jgi:hypothetical protein
MMETERERAIRERAYAIWEHEGRPSDKDLDHWLRAEVEIASTEYVASHLYRFRPIEKLLRPPYNELENQEIFLAHPSTLNDPMEGFTDIFWCGDAILWANLFRHYLICLNTAWVLLAGCGADICFNWDHIAIIHFEDPSVTQKAIYDEIFGTFFTNEAVSSYISALTRRAQPVRRNELAVHIRNLHLMAISVIHEFYERANPTPGQMIKPEIRENVVKALKKARTVIDLIEKLETEHPDKPGATDAFFAAHRRINEQLDFINRYNNLIDTTKNNKNFVFLEFPDGYVGKIEELVYPNWYTACFLAECRNSSVWGSYGDKHAGVCLKFKVRDRNGRPVIALRRMIGMSGTVSGTTPVHGVVDDEFYQVKYARQHPQVEFFRSLGRVPMPMLRRFWYSDRKGNRSACGDPIFTSQEEWRERYWDTFRQRVSTKTKDWSYEKEYRLVLISGEVLYFSDQSTRKVRYEFSDLEGIIFGINTAREDKDQIVKIIERKCRDIGRPDFKFYQAFYSPNKGTIEHAEMSLLKFNGLTQALSDQGKAQPGRS